MLRGEGESNQYLFAASIATLAFIILYLQLPAPNVKSHYPTVGVDLKHIIFKSVRQRLHWFKSGPQIIHNSFKTFPNAIYTLPSLDRTSIVLPPRFLEEIRDLPASIASNSHATSDVSIYTSSAILDSPCLSNLLTFKPQFFVGNWTTLDYDIFGHATINAIKTQYIAKIGQQIDPARNEAAYAFNKHFGRYQGQLTWSFIHRHL